jgi:hypothetical protein
LGILTFLKQKVEKEKTRLVSLLKENLQWRLPKRKKVGSVIFADKSMLIMIHELVQKIQTEKKMVHQKQVSENIIILLYRIIITWEILHLFNVVHVYLADLVDETEDMDI